MDGKLYRKASGNLKNNSFTTRGVSLRDKLDKDAIHAETVNKFKICKYVNMDTKKLKYGVVITDLGFLNYHQ